jgi:ADP-ribose pyrophosphatase
MKVHITKVTKEYKGFFTLEKANLQFEKFDGTVSEEIVRENFYRGDSVAALVYDSKTKLVLLVRQFRYPVYAAEPNDSWITELVAGSIKEDDQPVETLLRELVEEVHISASKENLQFISSFYVSPGGTSERIFLYGVDTELSDFQYKHGGLEDENEDIEIVLLPFAKVFEWINAGHFKDAKTIIALQWLAQKFT